MNDHYHATVRISDEQLAEWAAQRADDAGRLARELLPLRRAALTPAPQAEAFDKVSIDRLSELARNMQHCDDAEMYQDGQTILDLIARAAPQAEAAPFRDEALRAENERLRYVLEGVRGAISTGRNEPLMVWRDQIDIVLEDRT